MNGNRIRYRIKKARARLTSELTAHEQLHIINICYLAKNGDVSPKTMEELDVVADIRRKRK